MNAERAELLRVLTELCEEASDLRFGQMIANLATLARGPSAEAVWDSEDGELAAAANRLLAHYKQRQAGVA